MEMLGSCDVDMLYVPGFSTEAFFALKTYGPHQTKSKCLLLNNDKSYIMVLLNVFFFFFENDNYKMLTLTKRWLFAVSVIS